MKANVIEYASETAGNLYVEPLSEFVAELIAAGPGKAAELVLDPEDKLTPVKKGMRAAANKAGYSARLKTTTIREVDGVEHTVLLYTLGTLQTAEAKAERAAKKAAKK